MTEARDALRRCDWEAARTLLDEASSAEPVAEVERLDSLAEALWWLGDVEACIRCREEAYRIADREGRSAEAGQLAIWLYEHHGFMGRPAIGGGWLRRARRALDDERPDVVFGHLLLREAELLHGRGSLDEAIETAGTGLELGRRSSSVDLEAEALQTLGRILIDRGDVEAGLAHLDEAMLFGLEGRLRPYSTGKVYCSLVSACEALGDLRRAAEWTEATTRWSEQHPFAVFPGLCRIKRADVLRWQGNWVAAEREALRASDELAPIRLDAAATAWCEVGEIRRRVGDLDGAEDAFEHARRLDDVPTAGLALLRLAQGRVDEARSIIDQALGDDSWNRLSRARLLPAQVEIVLAAGQLEAAADAATELERIATAYASDLLRASARLARGRVELASGDPGAVATLHLAVEEWEALDVPYETASAALLLAHACGAQGDGDGERRWLASAVATFERLGAAYDARPLDRAQRAPCGLTTREVEVLRLVADGLTNKDIARTLVLSQKTVSRHLSNIFVKANVSTRSAATAFAFENRIVGGRG